VPPQLGHVVSAASNSKSSSTTGSFGCGVDPNCSRFFLTVAPYVARAFAELDLAPDEARADFERALALKTKIVWPYFYLAHAALTARDFGRVGELASQGLTFSNPDQHHVRAKLFEWWAIASAQQGRSDAEVRALFQGARGEDPTNATIAGNTQVFEEALVERRMPRQEEWLNAMGLSTDELRNAMAGDLSFRPLIQLQFGSAIA